MTIVKARSGNLASTLTVHAVILLLLVLSVPVVAAPRDPSLVAHYTFEEGPDGKVVKDWSGHGNNGRNMGAEYVKGPEGAGYVLRFEDSQAQVDCGNRPSLNLTDAFTIELWLYPETKPTKGQASALGGNAREDEPAITRTPRPKKARPAPCRCNSVPIQPSSRAFERMRGHCITVCLMLPLWWPGGAYPDRSSLFSG